MKILNKIYLLHKKVLIGDKNYNYKIKSILLKKLYCNYIYDFEQSFFFIKKAIMLTIENSKYGNNILIYENSNFFNQNLFSLVKKKITVISTKWIPGSLSNKDQYKKYNKIKIINVPNLIILLGSSNEENLYIFEEASSLNIPVIMLLPDNQKFDNLYFPLPGSINSSFVIQFYFLMLFNSILYGLFLEKKSLKSKLVIKNSFF